MVVEEVGVVEEAMELREHKFMFGGGRLYIVGEDLRGGGS